MPAHAEERREFQRLLLSPPIDATLGTLGVGIVEIGILGARVQHGQPVEEASELRFVWNDRRIALKCEIVRTVEREGKLQSGIRFLAAIGDSGDHLREMLADMAVKALENRRAGGGQALTSVLPDDGAEASGPVLHAVDGDQTVRGTDAAFLCYRLENGTWHRRRVFLPEQPASGFTVASGEDSEEIQRLCRVYAASDEEGRRLIRLFAELSVSDALQIPPRTAS